MYGLNGVHAGPRLQRGSGLFSNFIGLGKRLLPVIAKGSTKFAKQLSRSEIGKDVGRQLKSLAKDTAITAAVNAIEGKELNEGLSENLKTARRQIAQTIKKRNSPKKRKSTIPKLKKSRNKVKKYNFIKDDDF